MEDNWDAIQSLSQRIEQIVSAPGMRKLVEYVKRETINAER
jgi:hypothetical protein